MLGRLQRAALLGLALCAALAVKTTVFAQAPPGSLWYNGDWNGVEGLANERNTAVTQAAVYDDFDVTAPQGWNVTAVFSDNFFNTGITGADWEIRAGVSEGNAGTLVASGTTNSPLVTLTGRCVGNEVCEYQVEVTGVNVILPMLPSGQHYWLNVTPIGNGTGRSFNSTTSGANCAGTPCGNDDNAFWNSTYFGTFFGHSSNQCESCNDFSMGVIRTVVPEPATVVLLTLGIGTLLIALRRRRRAVLALALIAASVLNTTAFAQAPPGSLWYNGEFNSVNGLANERNTIVTQAAVYDDFNVTSLFGWQVTAVFSDNLENTVVTAADWEIRTGISEGNAGTLIASGTTNSPVVTLIGVCQEFCEYRIEVTGLNVFLPMLPSGQHYWLNVTPVGNGTNRSFNATTSGANCVGSPCGNDQNAFFNSTYFGAYFTSTSNEGQPYDYSDGVIGTVVPEPATPVLLTFGIGALLISLRRRRRPMLGVALIAALALNTTALAQAPPGSLWYNGDLDGYNGLSNERNTIVSQAAVYDDFDVTAPLGWHVTAVFSDNLFFAMTVTAADWEIRSGVSGGNAGTLVASGTTNSPIVTSVGYLQNEFMVEVTGLNLFLPMLPPGQHYWLNVTPVGNGNGRSFDATTSGADCVGSPCGNDGVAFFNSTYFGDYFILSTDGSTGCGSGCHDFSMGVIGTVVPEPAAVALLTCGLGMLIVTTRCWSGGKGKGYRSWKVKVMRPARPPLQQISD